tara:strand:+ start:90 stop:344 length:255 start_codon:yes stop_codon:yes gene_type:complete
MNFKEGDKVRVIKNIHGHEFELGQVITIAEVYEKDYASFDENGIHWFISDKEIEAFEMIPGDQYRIPFPEGEELDDIHLINAQS